MAFGIGGTSAARPAGREHIPMYPGFFPGLRIAQLVVTIVVLGLDAYGLSKLSFSGDELMMFTCVATVIVTVYCLVADLAAPPAYNYWAVLALDMLLVVFWLTSFALLASQVAPYMGSYTYCTGFGCYDYEITGEARTYLDCLAAASGLGGLLFLLFVAAVVINGLALHAHRAQGLHCTPATAGRPAAADAEKAAAASVAPAPAPAAAYQAPAYQPPASVPHEMQPYPQQVPVPIQQVPPQQLPAGGPY